jgi:HTH-type transcriptional regulator, fmd operon transcriptional regulator
LTEKQFRVLDLRSRGYSQREIAFELKMSRASVSMIEARAKKQVQRARQTLRMYKLTQSQHKVIVQAGTRLQQVPMVVLQEADRFRIHLRQNMVEILRMVKKRKAALISDGRTSEKIVFSFNERGKVSLL